MYSDDSKLTADLNNSNDMSDSSTAEGSDSDSDNACDDHKSCTDKIGAYSLDMRSKKILKYKSKIYSRRRSNPISKVFKGRSQVASQKVRVNGKFVKSL
jgi:hypothetical protein